MPNILRFALFLRDYPQAKKGFVVCRVSNPQILGERIEAISWRDLYQRLGSSIDSDDMITEFLERGIAKKDVIEMLVKEYMKFRFDEARELHEKLNEEYRKDNSYPKSIRIEASLIRIMRSDK